MIGLFQIAAVLMAFGLALLRSRRPPRRRCPALLTSLPRPRAAETPDGARTPPSCALPRTDAAGRTTPARKNQRHPPHPRPTCHPHARHCTLPSLMTPPSMRIDSLHSLPNEPPMSP